MMRPLSAAIMCCAVATLVLAVFEVQTGAGALVDFDDLTLAAESHWQGPDPDGTDITNPSGQEVRVGSFASGGVEFVNRFTWEYQTWSGFAYSNVTDVTTPGYLNQFSAFAGSGHGPGDDNYGVANGYRDQLDPADVDQLKELPFLELPANTRIESAYIVNTTYTALSMLNGDSFAKKFGGQSGNEPDWFKLTAYGTDAAGSPLAATVEFYLADYRFDDHDRDYIVDQWTQVDLSPLADARRIYFNLQSSDTGPWGMNTPAYFAIDDIRLTIVPEPSTLAIILVASLVGCLLPRVRT